MGDGLLLIGEGALADAAARALHGHGFAPGMDPLVADAAAIVAVEPCGAALPLAQLRARHDGPPLLVLSANRAVADRVRALDEGADDWLGAPFAPAELGARVRALLRRAARLQCGDLVLDLSARRAARAGRALALTAREFALLAHLARHRERVVGRAELLRAVWGRGFDPGTNSVAVHVSRLRGRLDRDFATPLLHTLPAGYMLSAAHGIGRPPPPRDLRRRKRFAQDDVAET